MNVKEEVIEFEWENGFRHTPQARNAAKAATRKVAKIKAQYKMHNRVTEYYPKLEKLYQFSS